MGNSESHYPARGMARWPGGPYLRSTLRAYGVVTFGAALGAGTQSIMSKNILIVRTDRVGDVLLTTPVSTAIKESFPDARVTWLVRPYTAPVLSNNPSVDNVLLDTGSLQ